MLANFMNATVSRQDIADRCFGSASPSGCSSVPILERAEIMRICDRSPKLTIQAFPPPGLTGAQCSVPFRGPEAIGPARKVSGHRLTAAETFTRRHPIMVRQSRVFPDPTRLCPRALWVRPGVHRSEHGSRQHMPSMQQGQLRGYRSKSCASRSIVDDEQQWHQGHRHAFREAGQQK